MAYVISKHGNCVQKITAVSCRNSLTESALAWSCLGNHLKEENKSFYTPKDKYVRNFIRETAKGGRVIALNHKFVSSSLNNIIKIREEYFGRGLEMSVLFEKHLKYNKVKKYYENKYKSRFSDYRRMNKDLFESYSNKKTR